jgi:phage terminase large subunit-like protein
MGAIIRLTSDPARLYGYSPTLVIVDELAFWTTPNLRRAYAALTSGGGARSAPQTFRSRPQAKPRPGTTRSWERCSMPPSTRRTSSASRG